MLLDILFFLYQSEEYPRDCQEVAKECASNITTSGVYLIKPDQYPEPFQVYCDNNDNADGWTVGQTMSILQRNFMLANVYMH